MRLRIIAVGRQRPGPLTLLFDEYRRRSPWPIELVEVEPRERAANADEARSREGALLAAAAGSGGTSPPVVVALDERGEDLASADLAARLGRWRDEGARSVAFLIGGADGLAPDLTARASLMLAFGRATWPHLLVRAMLAEQLYRAQTILAGHPYHRG